MIKLRCDFFAFGECVCIGSLSIIQRVIFQHSIIVTYCIPMCIFMRMSIRLLL